MGGTGAAGREHNHGGVPFVDLGSLHDPIADELTAAFARVLQSNAFVGGREVAEFEQALAAYGGVANAIGVGSGTAALHLALRAAGVGPGDEVILPTNSFFATAEAVLAAGAEPVLVDVSPETALMGGAAVAAAVTPRTAAVIPVHLYGQPANMDDILAVARRHGLFVLEDAAQAIGARWDGRHVGGIGDAGAFSFYPAKNLGALGDGGAVVTNDPYIADRVARLRSHGEGPKNVHAVAGFTDRLDGLQAALLEVKLRHLDMWQEARSQVVAWYDEALRHDDVVTRFAVDPRATHVYHLYVVQVPERDTVLAALHDAGIGAGVHYPTPIHLQPAWVASRPSMSLPVAEQLAGRILSLPLFPSMSAEQVEQTVEALHQAVHGRAAPSQRRVLS